MKTLAFGELEWYADHKDTLLIEAILRLSVYDWRYYFTPDTIYSAIYNGKSLSKKCRTEFIKSIEAIPWVYKAAPGKYYVEPEEVYNLIIPKPFVIVNLDEIKKIIDNKLHNEFLHYLLLISTFAKDISVNNKSYFTGYMRSAFFAQLENVDVQTIYRYNKKLEEAQLIHFSHSKFDKENCRMGEVYYCRYADRYLLETIHPDHRSAATANFRRSVSYRYTKFLKHPEQFTPEKIAQLREDVVRYNDQCAQLAQAGYTNAQPKDLSVFT